jgi:hypothetical protein
LRDQLRLRPTTEQYGAFGDYLRRAHSWYKHLPLLGGRQFVVFVSPDAGIGRLVAKLHSATPDTATGYTLMTPSDGPEFTDEHPRLHYGWKTTQEYRSRFGYLDYMYRQNSGEPYARDAGLPMRLPVQVEERCGFVLFPYISGMFIEAVTWSIHAEAIEQLRAGVAHPSREQVLELARLAKAHSSAWTALSDLERDWFYSRGTDAEKPKPEEPSASLRMYLDLDDSVRAVCRSLTTQEAEKIRRALAELDDWLLHGE